MENWTRTQKEYFYAGGTIVAQVALGFMVPPLALFAWGIAAVCSLLFVSVIVSNVKAGTIAKEKAELNK